MGRSYTIILLLAFSSFRLGFSIVTEDIPANVIAGGVPAKVIRDLKKDAR